MGSKSVSNEAQTVSALRCYDAFGGPDLFGWAHDKTDDQTSARLCVCTLGVLKVVDEVINIVII